MLDPSFQIFIYFKGLTCSLKFKLLFKDTQNLNVKNVIWFLKPDFFTVFWAELWIKYGRQSLWTYFLLKNVVESFFSIWSQILQWLHSKYFFPNWAIDGEHHWFDKNWLGRHKRGFLRTHMTSYIKTVTHCCSWSFFTEKTIWILTLFNVRLLRLHPKWLI